MIPRLEGGSVRKTLIVLAIILFVAAAAAVRVADLSAQPGQLALVDWAGMALLVFAMLGTAVGAERCYSKLEEDSPRFRSQAASQRRLESAQERLMIAQHQISSIAEEQREWDEKAGQLKAVYDATYFAIRPPTNGVGGPPSGNVLNFPFGPQNAA